MFVKSNQMRINIEGIAFWWLGYIPYKYQNQSVAFNFFCKIYNIHIKSDIGEGLLRPLHAYVLGKDINPFLLYQPYIWVK